MSAETGVRVALLGPLLVDGRPWAARSAAWRAILAALALKTGVIVSYDTLIEAAGLDQTSKDPKKALQTSVARLQARLELPILNQPEIGYWLDADPEQVDVPLFTRLCIEGRHRTEASEWRQASEALESALKLYRWTPFHDIDFPALENEWSPYLQDLWLQARKDRIRADIHLGHHESVIPELRTLTRTHPTEELFWALLMLAQYRSGSRPAAKRTYEAARDAMRQELDLEPGETVEKMRTQIRGLIPAFKIPVP